LPFQSGLRKAAASPTRPETDLVTALEILEGFAIGPLVSTSRAFLNITGIQEQAFKMVKLLALNEAAVRKLAAAGCFGAILEGMAACQHSQEVQEAGCLAIAQISSVLNCAWRYQFAFGTKAGIFVPCFLSRFC
jgi:hypothetical protein